MDMAVNLPKWALQIEHTPEQEPDFLANKILNNHDSVVRKYCCMGGLTTPAGSYS
jgi:hypothetical protein